MITFVQLAEQIYKEVIMCLRANGIGMKFQRYAVCDVVDSFIFVFDFPTAPVFSAEKFSN